MKKLRLLPLLLLIGGCSSTNISQFQKAVGDSHNTFVNKLSTIYGTDYLVFIGQQTNTDVTVSPDGTVTVKSH